MARRRGRVLLRPRLQVPAFRLVCELPLPDSRGRYRRYVAGLAASRGYFRWVSPELISSFELSLLWTARSLLVCWPCSRIRAPLINTRHTSFALSSRRSAYAAFESSTYATCVNRASSRRRGAHRDAPLRRADGGRESRVLASVQRQRCGGGAWVADETWSRRLLQPRRPVDTAATITNFIIITTIFSVSIFTTTISVAAVQDRRHALPAHNRPAERSADQQRQVDRTGADA
eukprot:156497-Pleurochrysis_carterae.AAC.1